jgi:hypothetical protein
MGDDKAGSAFAACGENSRPAALGGNHMLKIPDAADEIGALHVAKQRGTGHMHQLQPTHLPRLLSRQESACCSL